MRERIALAATALVLVLSNLTIYGREQLVTQGRVVLLELAPVDPRSLMQGDYMALRFKAANDAFGFGQTSRSDGRIVLGVDARGVAGFRRFDDGATLGPDEARMRYRIRNQQPKFGSNAYFFQEGQAALFATARYGEFRVAENGDAILTGLRGPDLTPLGPPRAGSP